MAPVVSRPTARLLRRLVPLAVLGLVLGLAGAAFRSERTHRAAAEQVLRDDAGMAGTEFIRRTAFDVAFNGYQTVTTALLRSAADGSLALSPRIPPQARALVAHLLLLEEGVARVVEGGTPPPWLEAWARSELSSMAREPGSFTVRHRVEEGRAVTLVLVPLGPGGQRVAAFDVNLDAQRPFLERTLARGPLLPMVIGDHQLTNAMMNVAYLDPTGAVRLEAGGLRRPEWEVSVPFGSWLDGVLAGSTVRVSIDPAAAWRLLPGGLPPTQLPLLAFLAAGAVAVLVLSVRADGRERALTQAREDFVVAVSHELRTPLAQIRLFTETVLLGRSRSQAEQRRFLEAAVRESIRLGRLVDNVLAFSRSDRGVLDVHPSPRRLAPLIAQVTEAFQPLASARRIHLALQLDVAARAAVDEAGFRRLLLNLLDNAVKYGPEQAEVTVRLAQTAEDVELAVEDRGPGIPERERESIFDPFQRLDRDRPSGSPGTGLGLALVRELAVRHGGACRIEDRAGGGARFVVTLPRVEGRGDPHVRSAEGQ